MKKLIWGWTIATLLAGFVFLFMSRQAVSGAPAAQPSSPVVGEIFCEPWMHLQPGLPGDCHCTSVLDGDIQEGTCEDPCDFWYGYVINCAHSTIGGGGGTLDCGERHEKRIQCPGGTPWMGVAFQCIGECPE